VHRARGGGEADVLACSDEPASALDPISTRRSSSSITELKKDYTMWIVTHNMQQAAARLGLHGVHVSRPPS